MGFGAACGMNLRGWTALLLKEGGGTAILAPLENIGGDTPRAGCLGSVGGGAAATDRGSFGGACGALGCSYGAARGACGC
eukprot:2814841-Rhodomonas_salina.3